MSYADRLDTDIDTFLKRHEQKQLLRFVTLGSVDDGKSTLIGRLLHDVNGVYEDQLADARQGSGHEGEIDFALITDGLVAEREQGITIDVAYRYFTTPKRKFIIADCPGHVQYTRNMATGASTADVAIILIDARHGVLQQSRRHAYIASLLGIPHLVVCINKMDAVGYDEGRFDAIRADFADFATNLRFHSVTPLPVSALKGDTVVTPSAAMPWYTGPTLLELLETLDVGHSRNMEDFRYPVQYVIRPHQNYRGYAGQIVSGSIRKGDPIKVLPAGTHSRVASIDTYDGEIEEAFAPMSVSLCLEEELDISRGDMLVHGDAEIRMARTFEAMVVWMTDQPLQDHSRYLIKHTTRYVRVGVDQIHWKLNMDTLAEDPTPALQLNDIGRVQMTAHQALVFDPYVKNRGAGCFVIVDPLTNNTVGAGMILEEAEGKANASERSGPVSREEREAALQQTGTTLWFTGTDSPEKTALIHALERQLFGQGHGVLTLNPQDPRNPAFGLPMKTLITIAGVLTGQGMLTLVVAPDAGSAASEPARNQFETDRFIWIETGAPLSGTADVTVSTRVEEHTLGVDKLLGLLKSRGVLKG